MEPSVATPAAPAQPATPPATTISPSRHAANTGDFAAFDKAETAKRTGSPLPDVAVKAAPAIEPPAAEPPAPAQVSKRQQQINDYERRIAEQNERIARLEARPATREPAAAAATPPETKAAEWKRLASMPDAPKLADFDSVEEHTAAMALFIADTRHAERIAEADQKRTAAQSDDERRQAVQTFDGRVDAIAKTDPEIVSKIAPVAQWLGETAAKFGGPAATLSKLVMASDVGPQLLRHFGANPEALKTLLTPPAALRGQPTEAVVLEHMRQLLSAFDTLEKSFASTEPPPAAPAASAAAVPSTITAAPPPAPTISRPGTVTDPQAAAFTRGDFAEWDRLETAKVTARRGAA